MFQSPDRGEPPAPNKQHILIVDDEPTLRLGFAYALTNKNTVVETAPTGRHALERATETRFDIMILDLRMPDLDGIGVIEALRSAGNEIPVILCSAALSPYAALRAIHHGVVDFLLKPVRPVDLRQVIESILRPERQPLPLALKAARGRRTEEAIQILENDGSPSSQTSCWLSIFQAIHETGPDDDTAMLEEQIRVSLPVLAFKSSADH